MDNLFLIRTLTRMVNSIQAPSRRIYNRLFQGKENMQPSSRLAFDILTGSEGILPNISAFAPATVDEKMGITTVTMQAPRISNKRIIHTADIENARAWGQQIGLMMMEDRVNKEQEDMRKKHDRTLEFWAANAIKGYIYDSDLSTVLVDYGMTSAHRPVLSGDELWTSPNSSPLTKLREFKRTIEYDSGAAITGWLAYLGSEVMEALMANSEIRELIKYGKGVELAEKGRIATLVETELDEYNGSFVDDNGTRQRFVNSYEFTLIGLCEDLTDVPFAPVVDSKAPNGVGNITYDQAGRPVPSLFFSKAWDEEDPSGRWVKVESRPLPVVQRPGAIISARVI